MPSIRLDELSPFGRLALKLDQEFAELARVSGELAALDVESDRGLDDAVKALGRASRCGQAIAEAMQGFSGALDGARGKAEADMKVVGERALLIQRRRQDQDALEERLARVKEGLQALGAGLAGARPPAEAGLSDEEKRQVAAELARLQEPMARFIEAASAVKAECARGKFRRLERQADSVIDSLQAARRKIASALEPK